MVEELAQGAGFLDDDSRARKLARRALADRLVRAARHAELGPELIVRREESRE